MKKISQINLKSMPRPTRHHFILGGILIISLVLATGLIVSFFSWRSYQGKIYPRTYLGSHKLSGLEKNVALKLIESEMNKIEDQGLKFIYNNKSALISPVVAAGPDGYAYDIYSLNPAASLQNIYDQQGENFGAYLNYRARTIFKDKIFSAAYQLNTENLNLVLHNNFSAQETAATNATFKIASVKDESFQVEPARNGQKINYALAAAEVEQNLKQIRNHEIYLKSEIEYPSVSEKDLPNLEPEAKIILARGDLALSFEDKTWTIKPLQIATWLRSTSENKQTYLTLDLDKIKEYLRDKIAPEIDQEIVSPRFTIINDQLANWQTGADGRKLNLETSAQKIQTDFIKGGLNSVVLIVDSIPTSNLKPENNFNIQEIIGTGHSNFAGSPANRRQNIKVGAKALNGLLIKPGEEFSLVKVLGDVDASSGYLPELVIKDNRTVPEYGGGLCQIGTTVFRAALYSGLPITARRNHSYRVSYYEPAGMDAAIYIPQPDVRFVNDTGNYILIQARIDKNDIYFDFWGVKDGRQITVTKPTVYNIVKPGPTKIIESPDLKPGEKKCTEKAHNGADAYFDYKVVYPATTATSSPEKNVRFSSHYVPWREVCLIGVSATSSATSTATSTSGQIATSTATSSPLNSSSSNPLSTSSNP